MLHIHQQKIAKQRRNILLVFKAWFSIIIFFWLKYTNIFYCLFFLQNSPLIWLKKKMVNFLIIYFSLHKISIFIYSMPINYNKNLIKIRKKYIWNCCVTIINFNWKKKKKIRIIITTTTATIQKKIFCINSG